MRRNDSYGILSARPCEFLDDRRAVVGAVVVAVGASTGVTKYDRGMYLLGVASRSAAS
jgi:hypothetical protein